MIADVSILGAIQSKDSFEQFLGRAHKVLARNNKSMIYITPADDTTFNKTSSLLEESGYTVPFINLNHIDNLRPLLKQARIIFIPAKEGDLKDYLRRAVDIVTGTTKFL
jgi:hypothetical protein